jgi:SAM-dependent methyltransferase
MLAATLKVLAWELAWWRRRRLRRAETYAKALECAHALQRPLIVIGAPDGGAISGYGCGDITIDMNGSTVCHNVLQVDITKGIPLEDDSAVVFCSCVLEYVSDHEAALKEIQRVSGGHAFFVGVEPWTLTAFFYPGAKRTLPAHLR